MSTNFKKVKAVEDGDGHWFVIPAAKAEEFLSDLDNEEMVDSGGFTDKWGEYETGGDLNLVQLWAEI